MKSSLFRRNAKMINLEIKDHVIRFVELKQLNGLSVHKKGEYLLPPSIVQGGKIEDYDTLKAILEQCIDEWKIAKRQVRFLVPDQAVFLRQISIDNDIKDDEIEGHLYLQLGTSIHLPFEEPVFDVVVLGENEQQKDLLLFAAAEEIVKQYSELLEDCKLKPVVADISSLANYRLYHKLDVSNENEHIMFLHVDLYGVNVSVFTDDKPSFMRYIHIPVDKQQWAISSYASEVRQWEYQQEIEQYHEELEEVYTEIDRVLSFYKYNVQNNEHEVTTMIVMGDHPFLSEITDVLKRRFALKVTALHDVNKLEVDNRYYLPIGLALRGGN